MSVDKQSPDLKIGITRLVLSFSGYTPFFRLRSKMWARGVQIWYFTWQSTKLFIPSISKLFLGEIFFRISATCVGVMVSKDREGVLGFSGMKLIGSLSMLSIESEIFCPIVLKNLLKCSAISQSSVRLRSSELIIEILSLFFFL